MATRNVQELWALAERQHGVVARAQLIEAELTPAAIKHRLARGRLHQVHTGVYAVGRPELSRWGRWSAALLAAGPRAVLSHASAAAAFGLGAERTPVIEVTVPLGVRRSRAGMLVYRRGLEPGEIVILGGLPVTCAARTLLDLAPTVARGDLDAAISQADKLDLIDPEALRVALEGYAGRVGVVKLRSILDRHTFVLTDSGLERRFMAIVRGLGLPTPEKRRINGFKVDFVWRELGLVVETDGLRYHRTAAAQTRDLRRDQTHWRAGLLPLRFSHAQIHYEADWVKGCMIDAVRSLTTGDRLNDLGRRSNQDRASA